MIQLSPMKKGKGETLQSRRGTAQEGRKRKKEAGEEVREGTGCLSLQGMLMGETVLCPLLSPPSHPSYSMVSDGTVAIFISLVMFILPSKIPGLTQDPSKHLPWGREGSPAAPVCRYIAFDHIWQEPAKLLWVICQRHRDSGTELESYRDGRLGGSLLPA